MEFEQVLDLLLEEGAEVYRFQSATIRTNSAPHEGADGQN